MSDFRATFGASAVAVAMLAQAFPASASFDQAWRHDRHGAYGHHRHHGRSSYEGCDRRWLPHCVVHGKPRNIFANPIGGSYPEIHDRPVRSGYEPLPDLTPSRGTVPAPTTTTPDVAPGQTTVPPVSPRRVR